MNPEYFKLQLTFQEADDYLAGLQRRSRHGYSQARMIVSIIGHLFAKDYEDIRFPWEDSEQKAPTKEEMEWLQEVSKKWESEKNNR